MPMTTPEVQRYRVITETKVLVETECRSGGSRVVGEYTVRSEFLGSVAGNRPQDIPGLVDKAMQRATKSAKVMAAGVDNTERNRLK